MNYSRIIFFSLSSMFNSRMLKAISSRSRLNSSRKSYISWFTWFYLFHSFLSLFVLSLISSSWVLYCFSNYRCLVSLSSNSFFKCSSFSLCFANSSYVCFNFFSACSAFSMALVPFMTLFSMFLSFLNNSACSYRAFSSSSSFFLIFSSSLLFSSSAICFWDSICLRSRSAFIRISSFSLLSWSSSSFICSLLTLGLVTKFWLWPPYWFLSCSRSSGLMLPPPIAANSARSFWISSWNSLNMASLGSSLILGLFLMFLALLAYLRVLMVSS
mmetsp:Transcript_62294/g.135002  ORF Transcript_62294/g.135002 Transcript_62294/m.135002 type:complete len:271 (-) Transcript_62294:967-1779(-)